jgi:hypothetical protein
MVDQQVDRNKQQRIVRQRRKELRCHDGIETTIHSGMPENLSGLLYTMLCSYPQELSSAACRAW